MENLVSAWGIKRGAQKGLGYAAIQWVLERYIYIQLCSPEAYKHCTL